MKSDTAANFQPLPIVAPPYTDEALCSWLHRVAKSYGLTVKHLLQHCNVTQGSQRANSLTLEVLSPEQLEPLARYLRVSQSRLLEMNARLDDCFGDDAQVGVCMQCLRDDVAQGNSPHIRGSWLRATAVECVQHRHRLFGIANRADGVDDLYDALRTDSHPAEIGRLSDSSAIAQEMAATLQRARVGVLSEQDTIALYGLSSSFWVDRIASDVVETLLSPVLHLRRGNPIMSVACLLEQEHLVAALSVWDVRQIDKFPKVPTIAARRFAISVVHALMTYCVNAVPESAATVSYASLRSKWFWSFLNMDLFNNFKTRSGQWPLEYVEQCWPELSTRPNSLLHRVRFADRKRRY